MKYLTIRLRFLLLAVVFIVQTAVAQKIKWTEDGKGFYETEAGGIIQKTIQPFSKQVIVTKEQLIPQGKSKAISVRDFTFSADGNSVLIYTNAKKVWRRYTRGDYWVYNKNTHTLQQLGKGRPESSLMFAKFSPDGKMVAYVSEHNIYAEDLATGTIKPLTQDGTARIINGTFDWAYEEEFGCRDGFRWSPDSKSIAYWQIDATKIRNFLMINNTDSIYSFVVPVEYPKVLENPSACKIGIVPIATGITKWMQIPGDAQQHYVPRMEWVDANELIIQQLNRKQQESKIMLVNTTTAKAKTIHEEKDTTWVDIKSRWNNDDPSGWDWINKGNEFIWVSEKDGWRHIYAISKDGKKERLLTKGNYDVITPEAIDEKNGFIYFTASPENATQQYLYRVKLNGTGSLEMVTPKTLKGTHSYQMAPNGLFAKHSFSNVHTPNMSEWVSLPQHTQVEGMPQNMGVAKTDGDISFIQITTDEGVTMDGWMVKPENFDSTKKYPVVFYVYTEPGSTTVTDTYGGAGNFLYAGNMAADGYIQISIDGRGTPAPKGAAWRKSIYRKVGILNVHDQAMAAKKIMQWSFVDTSRIAVWGWSGGGSTTLNLLFQHPDIYKTGIAIAPVANRLSYDNIYEERYMGLDKADYIKASAIHYAKNLRGNLLVIHGTGDDNVHYQNTEMLVNELVKHGKQFQMMAYPNRTHGIGEGQGTFQHLSALYTAFLQRNCAGGGR